MKQLWKYLIAAFAIVFVVVFGCPIYNLWGVCCPLCGTTRAWISFLTGNILAAFQYHPLFLITPVWFLAIIHYDHTDKGKKAFEACLIGFAALLAILNLLRILGLLPYPGCVYYSKYP